MASRKLVPVVGRRRVMCLMAAGGLMLVATRARAAETKRRFDVVIRARKVVGKNRVVRVTQGETVELSWTTDEATTVHLHGYDLKAKLRPGAPVSLIVKARAAGRFPITAHGFGHGGGHREKTLLYLEVHPR